MICICHSSQDIRPRLTMDFSVCSAQSAPPTDSPIRKPPTLLLLKLSMGKGFLVITLCICRPMLLFFKKITRKSKRYNIQAHVYLCLLLLDSTDIKIIMSNSYKFSTYLEFPYLLRCRPVTMRRQELVLRLPVE